MGASPWAMVIVAVIGVGGVLATLLQRSRSEAKDRAHRTRHDERTEWWRRYQWAAEQVNQRDNIVAQEFGRAVMIALARETSVTDSEIACRQWRRNAARVILVAAHPEVSDGGVQQC